MSYLAARSAPKLTPFKQMALRQMCRQPLTKAVDGWHSGPLVSQDGTRMPFNSHTVTWLNEAGYVAFEGKDTAKITPKGRELLQNYENESS